MERDILSLSVPCEYMASFSQSLESFFKGGKNAILFRSAKSIITEKDTLIGSVPLNC